MANVLHCHKRLTCSLQSAEGRRRLYNIRVKNVMREESEAGVHKHYRSEQEEEEGVNGGAPGAFFMGFLKSRGSDGDTGSGGVQEVLYGFLLSLIQRRYTLCP